MKLVPNVGPLRRAVYKPLPAPAQETFRAALAQAVTRYQQEVRGLAHQRTSLPDLNLDTGKPVDPRRYPPADEAFYELVTKLADKDIEAPAPLFRDVARFYGKDTAPGSAPPR